jgi:hypothetical protein
VLPPPKARKPESRSTSTRTSARRKRETDTPSSAAVRSDTLFGSQHYSGSLGLESERKHAQIGGGRAVRKANCKGTPLGVSLGITGQNANQCNINESGVYDIEAAPKAHIRTVKQRQVRLTQAQIAALVVARQSGMTINGLAAVFGIHRTTVMRHLDRRNAPTNNKARLSQ